MQNPLSPRFTVGAVFLALLLSIAPAAIAPAQSLTVHASASASASVSVAAAAQPCPTCAQAIGLDAFRASIQGEIIPVIVELQELPGVMTRIAAERAGQVMGFKELTGHSAGMHAKQRAFIATLPQR